MNPCPCGFYPDRQHCNCSQNLVNKYFGKIKGPILDRIDICVGTSRLELTDLSKKEKNTNSQQMREKILIAQQIQNERFKDLDINFNSQMEKQQIEEFCRLEQGDKEIMDKAFNKYNMSARGYYKVLKVARTIADMEESKDIKREHLVEAIGYRNTYEG